MKILFKLLVAVSFIINVVCIYFLVKVVKVQDFILSQNNVNFVQQVMEHSNEKISSPKGGDADNLENEILEQIPVKKYPLPAASELSSKQEVAEKQEVKVIVFNRYEFLKENLAELCGMNKLSDFQVRQIETELFVTNGQYLTDEELKIKVNELKTQNSTFKLACENVFKVNASEKSKKVLAEVEKFIPAENLPQTSGQDILWSTMMYLCQRQFNKNQFVWFVDNVIAKQNVSISELAILTKDFFETDDEASQNEKLAEILEKLSGQKIDLQKHVRNQFREFCDDKMKLYNDTK